VSVTPVPGALVLGGESRQFGGSDLRSSRVDGTRHLPWPGHWLMSLFFTAGIPRRNVTMSLS
jgi:hypothetical protein